MIEEFTINVSLNDKEKAFFSEKIDAVPVTKLNNRGLSETSLAVINFVVSTIAGGAIYDIVKESVLAIRNSYFKSDNFDANTFKVNIKSDDKIAVIEGNNFILIVNEEEIRYESIDALIENMKK